MTAAFHMALLQFLLCLVGFQCVLNVVVLYSVSTKSLPASNSARVTDVRYSSFLSVVYIFYGFAPLL